MNNSDLLGKDFAQLWGFHDLRQLEKLENTAVHLLVNIGFTKKKSNLIASHIKKAYQLHGEIDDLVFSKKQKEINRKLVEKYKKKIMGEMDKAFKLAGFKNHKTLSYYHSSWWVAFSFTHVSKNKLLYLSITWYLFMFNLKKIGKIFPSLRATYRLCLAGIYGHDKRNKKRVNKELAELWKIYLESDLQPFIF